MTTTLKGDLYASLKILLIWFILAISVYPTILSGEMSLIKGKSLDMAIVAANAVLPEFEGPSQGEILSREYHGEAQRPKVSAESFLLDQ